jgi:hypothetical protein
MSISASDSAWLCRQFDATDMDALNARAAMLQRLDNKYIVDAEVLERALPVLTRHFDMLEIGGLRAFSYENCYFDGPLLQSYFDHHQGRRKRSKVRMRKYTDTGLCFVEIKLKDKRGVTVKRRVPCDAVDFGSWNQAAQDHVNAAYREMYQNDFPHALGRTIDTNYTRMTLVAKQGGERLTIDSGLHFLADGRSRVIDERFFILETKSANGNGLADRILRSLHQHPVKHCSKYCTGLVFLRDGLKHNNFKSALRKLGRLPAESFGAALLMEQS